VKFSALVDYLHPTSKSHHSRVSTGRSARRSPNEALVMGTATQLRAVSSLTSLSVAEVDLPMADSMRVLGVTLDRRHTRHLLTLDLAQTLACSLIISRIDYCNSVLHGATSSTIQKLQRVQNNAARRPTRTSTIRRQLAASDAALAACWTAHQLQVGRADVQDSAYVISAVYEPAHLVAHQRMQHSIVVRPTAVRAISTDIICQAGDRSALPHLWLGTHCHLLCESATLSTFKSLNVRWCILRYNPFRNAGCSLIEEPPPQKTKKKNN